MTPIELIAHRKLIGLTQHALGEAFGVSRVTISRWERGHEAIPVWVPLAIEALVSRYFASVAHLMPPVAPLPPASAHLGTPCHR